ncbi:PAS domain S-box protein [Geobacter argillaceus]|uniref:histidine kinase n=1 Tax=Geobacter argillaceus TaxID=345631 RepID=A0A562VMU7_9BACT|nr:PAS domain S-box protein [Geobacter argillaceus]TWJ19230.1 PAS domain S-box-containing protein [Geobacter argillaceus]
MKLVKTLKQALVINSLFVALLPMLGVGFVSYKLFERDFLEDVGSENMALAKILAREASDYLSLFREQVTAIARTDRCSDTAVSPGYSVAGKPDVLCLARRDGTSPLFDKMGERFGLAHFAGDNELFGKGRPAPHHWSDVFVSVTTGLPAVSLAVSVDDDRSVVGSVGLQRLDSMVMRVTKDQRYAYIVDRQGRLVSHPDATLVRKRYDGSNLSVIKNGLMGKYGTYRYTFQGTDRIASITVIPETGWLLAVAQPVEQAFAPLRKVKVAFAVGLGATVLLALISALWSLKHLLRPLDTLGRNAQLITAGDYGLKTQTSGFEELDLLADRFILMAEAVDQREEELKHRNEELTMTEEELRQQMDESMRGHDELCKAHLALQTVVDASPVAISCLGLDGTVVLWNPAAEKTFGWQAAEVLGKLSPLILPEKQDESPQVLQEVLRDGVVVDREIQRVRKSGETIDLRLSGTALRGGDGVPYGILALYDDITERKRAEEEILILNAELEQRVAARTVQLEAANRELESFCYAVSHDLRAPLRHIDGFSHALIEDCGALLPAEGRDDLERVRRATARMAQLIDDLLELSRMSRGEIQLETVDLSGMVREILGELANGYPDRSVEAVIAEGVQANADPRLIRVVMDNLLGNAWKYTSHHQFARIEFGTEKRNGVTVYYVRDDGAGFDMAYAEKLFGPFQRLHSVDEFEGTGVGLATVQRIIHRHGGSVWGEGALGAGATFSFTLPGFGIA